MDVSRSTDSPGSVGSSDGKRDLRDSFNGTNDSCVTEESSLMDNSRINTATPPAPSTAPDVVVNGTEAPATSIETPMIISPAKHSTPDAMDSTSSVIDSSKLGSHSMPVSAKPSPIRAPSPLPTNTPRSASAVIRNLSKSQEIRRVSGKQDAGNPHAGRSIPTIYNRGTPQTC